MVIYSGKCILSNHASGYQIHVFALRHFVFVLPELISNVFLCLFCLCPWKGLSAAFHLRGVCLSVVKKVKFPTNIFYLVEVY